MKGFGQVLSASKLMIGKSTKPSKKTWRTPPKLKNQTGHGGCLLLTFYCNLRKCRLARFFLKIGRCILLRVNGQERLMEVDALFYSTRAPKLKKVSKMTISNPKATINGLTTLSLESKSIRIRRYISVSCWRTKIWAHSPTSPVASWWQPVNPGINAFGNVLQIQIL